MARASTIQHAFNAGELSSLLLGRQDVSKYANGLFVCLNGIPLVQGAWSRRPGTAFLHQAKHNDKVARVIPFQFSVTQTYVLEFGDEYVRFYSVHGILTEVAQSVTTISQEAVGKATKVAHGYSNGDRLHLVVEGMTQLNGREVVVANKTADDFELYDSDGAPINTAGYDSFTSGTMAEIFEVETPYTEDDLAALRFVQSADVLYLTHPLFKPRQLVRTDALEWSLTEIVFTDGPYDLQNTTATTLTMGATTGSGVTMEASSIVGINGGVGFLATDVGRLVRFKSGGPWGYARIASVVDEDSATVDILSDFSAGTASTVWRLGTWSDTTGYPAVATFHEDRLFFAGATLFAQRLDGSKSSSYTNFSPSATDGTIAADNAVAFTLNSDDVNVVRWMSSNEKGLLVGTTRGEWVIRASSLLEPITPTNIQGKPASRRGSADVAPALAGKATLFVQRSGRKVRELAYVFEVDGFKAPDMTVLAEHITRPSITEVAYQEQPQAIMWGVRADGVLLGLTYERDQDVVGWHRHELGGFSDAGHTLIPAVESVAVVTDPSGTRDELYMIVQRYINGGVKRYVEYMSKIWEVEDAQEDAFYADCGWTQIDGSPTAEVDSLWHLEGETVGAYVDGMRHPDVTVTNGKITLNIAGTIKTLGYFYQSDGQNMPFNADGQDGSGQGKLKRLGKIGFWLVDTLGLKYGRDADHLTELLVRTWGANMGEATPLFTGVVRERFEGDNDRLGQVYWRADGPFPANVLAIMPQGDTSDDS